MLVGFFEIDCQLRGIYFEEILYLRSLSFVLVVVDCWKQRIICFWIVVFSVLYDNLFIQFDNLSKR